MGGVGGGTGAFLRPRSLAARSLRCMLGDVAGVRPIVGARSVPTDSAKTGSDVLELLSRGGVRGSQRRG